MIHWIAVCVVAALAFALSRNPWPIVIVIGMLAVTLLTGRLT